jgi:hypothetical protein
MIAEYALDNLLVRQKDRILDLCNAEKYEEALTLLDFAEEMWAECSYAYKTREIRDRIRRALNENIWNAEHWKQKEKLQKLLATVPH